MNLRKLLFQQLDKEKKLAVFLCAAVAFCALISGSLSWVYQHGKVTAKEITLGEDVIFSSEGYLHLVDPVKIEDGMIKITGWAIRQNQDSNYVNRKVLLTDQNGRIYAMPTVATEIGLTEYFHDGFNYDLRGIQAQCPVSQFEKGSVLQVAFLVIEQDGSQHYLYSPTEINI